MEFTGVYHKTSEQMSYPLNEDELVVNLKTGFILAAGAALVFGFADCRLDGTVYMAVCLLGLAMMYGSSRGMSREY